MKSNIDLTSNEMFSRNPVQSVKIIQMLLLCDKFPWNYREMTHIKCDADLGTKFKVIYTGNREERKKKKYYEQLDSGNICDRCGCFLDRIPWNRSYDLCLNCMNALDKEYGGKKYPWSFFKEIHNTSLNW